MKAISQSVPYQEPVTVGNLFIEGKSHSSGETFLMIVSHVLVVIQNKIDGE